MICLNLGCGPKEGHPVHALFRTYDIIRVDADESVDPDIVADVRDLSRFADAHADGVFCWHVLEHLYAHEVVPVLRGFLRVLKPGGLCIIGTPDLQVAAYQVAMSKVNEPIYQSPVGPIFALDMLYGHRAQVAAGNEYMAHKTAFTSQTLSDALREAGFAKAKVHAENYGLTGMATKERNERND